MQQALVRAMVTTGRVTSFDDLKANGTRVFVVTAPGCEHCAKFETESMDDAKRVSESKYGPNTRVMTWSCDTDAFRGVAMRSGIDDVPCVVVVDRNTVQCFDAFSFVRSQ